MKNTRTAAVACLVFLCAFLVGGLIDEAAAQAKPEGEMRWAMYVTLAPVWLDPASPSSASSRRSGSSTRSTTRW